MKLGAAVANHDMGLLSDELFNAISQACREIMEGKFHEFFPVDMIQGGAGTTTNMNANEVIANRALEIMGHARGEYHVARPTTMSTARSLPTTPTLRRSTSDFMPRTSNCANTSWS